MNKTFNKASKKVVPSDKVRHFDVYVVVRHTRGGDDYKRVLFEKKYPSGKAREHAMEIAEDIANDAARDYGQGSASVFKGSLTMANKAEQP